MNVWRVGGVEQIGPVRCTLTTEDATTFPAMVFALKQGERRLALKCVALGGLTVGFPHVLGQKHSEPLIGTTLSWHEWGRRRLGG
jgi:hypothetical protein